ncbi:MAG TPA: hypothetical protein VKB57_06940 [Acidimicrobiales bacterium]|nr:hypothetical protein [Acidimicrobiales bacterium]
MGRAPDRWAWAALAWAVAIGVAWLMVPAGTSTSTAVSSDGTVVTETSHPTLLASEGAGVLVPLAVPVVVAGAAVAAGRSRRARGVRLAAGGLLLAGCLVALLSVGLFYVPAGVALVVAGSLTATAV